MDNKNRVTVIVAGQRFTILTEKSEKYVLDIASRIDARINSLVVSGDMTRERAAVLTALDFADDGEKDKENIAAVKEQMKDYIQEIERLQDERAKLGEDYRKLKEEYERLIAERQYDEDARKAPAEAQSQIGALTEENERLKAEIEKLRQQPEKSEEVEEAPAPAEDAPEEKKITAEDDLFFDEEEPVKLQPQPQKKKNRHEHSHVNPYQQKAAEKKKGYTQQRQYSLFDIDEED